MGKPDPDTLWYNRATLKLKAVAYLGGKCVRCGYDKCPNALEFHHRDPNTKEHMWHALRVQRWDHIAKELDKYDLLCSNCHKEEHWDEGRYERIRAAVEARRKRLGVRFCTNPSCGRLFKPVRDTQTTCSRACVYQKQAVVSWPADLPRLVAESSLTAVGKLFGVSRFAVRQRLDKYHTGWRDGDRHEATD